MLPSRDPRPPQWIARALRGRGTPERVAAGAAGLGLAVLVGWIDRAGAAGLTSAALGALVALTVYKSIGRK